jgi:hypothetical protein
MTDTVAELPLYATRVSYGRELDGLLADSEKFDSLDNTDVAEITTKSRREARDESLAVADEIAGDVDHDPAVYEVTQGADPSGHELGPDENTQRSLERVLDESFIERRANQQRRSGNT